MPVQKKPGNLSNAPYKYVIIKYYIRILEIPKSIIAPNHLGTTDQNDSP